MDGVKRLLGHGHPLQVSSEDATSASTEKRLKHLPSPALFRLKPESLKLHRRHKVKTLFPYGFEAIVQQYQPEEFTITTDSNGNPSIVITASVVAQSLGQPIKRPKPQPLRSGQYVKQYKVPTTWLRDHCQCSKCINPETKQREISVFSFKEAPKLAKLSINDSTHCVTSTRSIDGSTAEVTWSDGHRSSYSLQWLANAFDHKKRVLERQGYVEPIWWTNSNVREAPPQVRYVDVMDQASDFGIAELMMKMRQFGFCFIDGTPPTPYATEELLKRIGPIRNTHYGAFWDFTSNMEFKDTAYTDLALDVHTDTNYFTDSAGLQLFHLLQHTGSGGESQLVDGFQVARRLHKKHPEAYNTLARTKMFFHASGNEDLSIQPHTAFPVLVHDEVTKMLTQIRWNPYDKAAFAVDLDAQPEELEKWYEAASLWNNMLQSKNPSKFYEFQLKPGRPLLFDNWRVLHGRSAFTGKRRMCGGYINRDDFISRFRTSNYGHEQVLQSGIY